MDQQTEDGRDPFVSPKDVHHSARKSSNAVPVVQVSLNPNRIIMQGILSKRGRTTKTWKDRWYVLKDKFLYHYKIARHREGTDGEPISVEFIQGCTVEIDENESEKQTDKFCFSLTFPEGRVKRFWTKAYQEREH